MDPLSIVALTIKVLDQLWKMGDRTATLISNFRDFDSVSCHPSQSKSNERLAPRELSLVEQDTRVLENKIRDENNRTRALHMLLFDPSSVSTVPASANSGVEQGT